MPRSLKATFAFLVLTAVLYLSGCQKGPEKTTLSVSAPAKDTKQRLSGTWQGKFAMRPDAPVEDFDETTIEICKSISVKITFFEDGRMDMEASMKLPDVGPQTNTGHGQWSIVSGQGDEITLRTVQGQTKPEEVLVSFDGDNSFEMTPPNELKDLGVLRFTRS